MVTVTLLGTAALMPTPERALASAVIACLGQSLLLDCGEGTQTAARRHHVSLMNTSLIALTHYHGDHIFGLPGLLQTMGSMNRTLPLTIAGPDDIERELNPILRLVGWVPFEIHLESMPQNGLCLHEINPGWPKEAVLTAFPTEHRVASQGYRFTLSRPGRFLSEKAMSFGLPKQMWRTLQHGEAVEYGGRRITPSDVLGPSRQGLSVVYSGDTTACESLTANARDADLFICEGTYGDGAMLDAALKHGHMTFEMAGKTAAEARVRRLWLTHFSQMMDNPADFLPEAERCFPGAVVGEDGMSIELNYPPET